MTHKVRSNSRLVWAFVLTSLAGFMVTLDNLVVTTALPVIRHDLGASLDGLEWTVNAYTLTFAVLLLTGAALGDRFGRRRMLALGLAIFTVSSAAAALAPSILALDVARAFQGIGGAIVMPLTLTILSAAVPQEKRGLALGAWGGITGLAVAFGPLVGGAVVSGISWQWIFWLNVPIGLVLIPLVLLRLDESRGPWDRLDLPGLALAGVGLLGIVWGLVRGNALGLGLGSGPRRDPRRLRRDGAVRSLGAEGACADASDALLPQPRLLVRECRVALLLLRDVRLDLPARAVLPDRAGLLSARLRRADPPLDGDADDHRADRRRAVRPDRRAPHHGRRAWPCRRSGSPGSPRSRPRRRCPTTTSSCRSSSRGAGMAMFFAPVANVVLSSVRPVEQGQASGANNAIRELGGVLGVAVLASIFAHEGGYSTADTFVHGTSAAVYVGAAVVAIGAVAAALIRPRRKAAQAVELVPELEAAA